ncbi:MAG TPA: cytochrome c3 family protein [Candidatus Angelobacter sp.]|nr:cytochrome c3 family protein [Candidatus Angelobacter sp.]
MRKYISPVLLAMLLVSGARLSAGVHPVPLEPNTDAAKCLECHEDKGKGAHVHSAVALGCTSCHEIRTNKNVTRIKLTTTTSSKLCLSCHAEKNAAEIKGKVHPPAVRDCVKCHDPHQSPNEQQLLKPVSGDQKDNLCLSCHTMGLNVPAKGSRHAALDMGCNACHTVHKSGDPNKLEFAYHLTKTTPQLCLDCHDAKSSSLQKAHANQPFGTSNCVQCHDPHQSSRPKLMQAFVHSPFEGGTSSCDTCHQPVKDNKVVLTQASAKELCVTCHAEKAEQIEKSEVQHPGAAGDCTDCHNPHAGKSPGFPKPDAVSVCLSCHSDQAELFKKKHLHQPAFEQGCATCHEPHGGENQHLLRAKETNALCLECHGPEAPEPKPVAGQPLVTIFNGHVTLPQDYFKKVPVIPLKYGTGHPVIGHPVANTLNTKTNTPVAMTCLSCHQPHASVAAGLLVKDQEANMAFCKNCHAEGTIALK